MAIFNSYVKLPEGISKTKVTHCGSQISQLNSIWLCCLLFKFWISPSINDKRPTKRSEAVSACRHCQLPWCSESTSMHSCRIRNLGQMVTGVSYHPAKNYPSDASAELREYPSDKHEGVHTHHCLDLLPSLASYSFMLSAEDGRIWYIELLNTIYI